LSNGYTDTQSLATTDRVISDYLDALFTTPMPAKVFRSRHQLVKTIDVRSIIAGQYSPNEYEATVVLLTLLRLVRQLPKNQRVQQALLEAAHVIVAYLELAE